MIVEESSVVFQFKKREIQSGTYYWPILVLFLRWKFSSSKSILKPWDYIYIYINRWSPYLVITSGGYSIITAIHKFCPLRPLKEWKTLEFRFIFAVSVLKLCCCQWFVVFKIIDEHDTNFFTKNRWYMNLWCPYLVNTEGGYSVINTFHKVSPLQAPKTAEQFIYAFLVLKLWINCA